MPKLVLKSNPTFKATVVVPIAGDPAGGNVVFEFKHRRKKELAEFMTTRAGKTDLETVMDCACGWDLEEPFNADTVN
jgi:hypothetical protein